MKIEVRNFITEEVRNEFRPQTYKKYYGKGGKVWLLGNCPNCADFVFVSANSGENEPGYRGFRGFGGSKLRFKLDDTSVLELQGPWHSNSSAFFSATGVDIRDKHLTFFVIGKKRTYVDNRCFLADILERDEKPTVGEYYRGTKRAMEISRELDQEIYCYSESYGGSSCGLIYSDQIDVHGKRPEKV